MAYGMRIRNAAGTITLDTTTRHGNLLIAPTTLSVTTGSTNIGGSGPVRYQGFSAPYLGVTGITASNTTDIQVHVVGFGIVGTNLGYGNLTTVTVDRGLSGNVRLIVNSVFQNTTFSYKVMVFRF